MTYRGPKREKNTSDTAWHILYTPNWLKLNQKLVCDALSHDEIYIFQFFYKILSLVRVILFCQNIIAPFLYNQQNLLSIAVNVDLHEIYNCLQKKPLLSACLILEYDANNMLRYDCCHIRPFPLLTRWFTYHYVMWHIIHFTI